MLAAERQRRLLDLARKNGTVRTTDLATDFSVTEETIRRDLDFLARMGHLRRTHGGAMDTSVSLGELSQSEREARQLEEKFRSAAKPRRWSRKGKPCCWMPAPPRWNSPRNCPTACGSGW